MLDIKLLRDDIEFVAKKLKVRGVELDIARFQTLENERKTLQVETQQLQSERNTLSKSIGQKKAQGEDISELLKQVSLFGDKLDASKTRLAEVLDEMHQFMLRLPNLPHDDVPMGKDENDNVELCLWGEPKSFSFTPKSHDDLGEALGMMDFGLSAKVTGSRFVVLKKDLVRLQRAITLFMLDMHTTKHGYDEVYVPYIVNKHSLLGSGQLPKFEEDLFKLKGEHDYYLTSTGEVPVVNLSRDMLFNESDLPIKYVSHTPCFRSEAGSYGRDTKGMIRQHQFEKVELIWVTDENSSYQALEELKGHAEAILQALELPYRVVTLCSGDMSDTSSKTYDLEVYLPSQQMYREISSCSNCQSYQGRRMQTRYRVKGEKETRYVHTLNGSGLAVGRTLVAIMENYQDEDGNIHIPTALQAYMGRQTLIKK